MSWLLVSCGAPLSRRIAPGIQSMVMVAPIGRGECRRDQHYTTDGRDDGNRVSESSGCHQIASSAATQTPVQSAQRRAYASFLRGSRRCGSSWARQGRARPGRAGWRAASCSARPCAHGPEDLRVGDDMRVTSQLASPTRAGSCGGRARGHRIQPRGPMAPLSRGASVGPSLVVWPVRPKEHRVRGDGRRRVRRAVAPYTVGSVVDTATIRAMRCGPSYVVVNGDARRP